MKKYFGTDDVLKRIFSLKTPAVKQHWYLRQNQLERPKFGTNLTNSKEKS